MWIKKLCFAVCIATMLFFPVASAAGDDVVVGNVQMDKEQLREVIAEILKEDPELIYNAYNAHKRNLQKRKEKQLLENSFKNRIVDPIESWHPVKGPENAPVTLVMYMDYQ